MRATWTDERLDDFREHVDQRFDAVDHRFDEVDRQLDHLAREAVRNTERLDALHRLLAIFAIAVITVLGTTCTALVGLLFTRV